MRICTRTVSQMNCSGQTLILGPSSLAPLANNSMHTFSTAALAFFSQIVLSCSDLQMLKRFFQICSSNAHHLGSTVPTRRKRQRETQRERRRKRESARAKEGCYLQQRRCGCLITSLSRTPKYASFASTGRGAPLQRTMDLRGKIYLQRVSTFSRFSFQEESRGIKNRRLRQRKMQRSLQ